MSIFDSFTKKPKLGSSINQSAEARNSEGVKAEQLYQSAYKGYGAVLVGDSIRSEALYEWGFALFNHAKTKSANEAIKLYQDAIAKFSFCLLLNPDYLGAALNGGVACMDLARLKQVGSQDDLYEMAKESFEKANRIQVGSASYNLACIHALRNEKDESFKALQYSEEKGFLPDVADIQNDPDLGNIQQEQWFLEFIAKLNKKAEAAAEKAAAEKRAKEEARLAKEGLVKESIKEEPEAKQQTDEEPKAETEQNAEEQPKAEQVTIIDETQNQETSVESSSSEEIKQQTDEEPKAELEQIVEEQPKTDEDAAIDETQDQEASVENPPLEKTTQVKTITDSSEANTQV